MDSVRDILMVEIVPMNFSSYQKLVKIVKNVHSKGLSYELALENWGLIGMVFVWITLSY